MSRSKNNDFPAQRSLEERAQEFTRLAAEAARAAGEEALGEDEIVAAVRTTRAGLYRERYS